MTLPANVRSFLAFRVCFNARFYYPVLAVFFVDLGLTLDQYALLNVAWAASIVCFELPLGAVADRIGRRPLVVGAAALMVVEMAVLAFAPTGNPTLLFAVFLVNRVLSGLAEAAASGADEALAYDTLLCEGRRDEWPRVLTRLQNLMSGAFLLAMVVGGLVYDPAIVNAVFGTDLDQLTTARFPVYLTLLLSLGALWAALRMTEPGPPPEEGDGVANVAESWQGIKTAGRWIVRERFALAIILFVLCADSVVRLFLTLTSSYYRMVGLPEGVFGLLGAAFAALGFLSPPLANRLLRRTSPLGCFLAVAGFTLLGLAGIGVFDSWIGVLFVAPLGVGMHLLGFFGSHFLNEVTESERRATVLSIKSLAGNLAYGAIGGLYALLYRLTPGDGDATLSATLLWLPFVFLATAAPLFVWARGIKRMR